MNLVVDASVAVKWFLQDSENEEDSDLALLLLQQIQAGEILPIQPPHWLAEVAAVMTRLRPSIGREVAELLFALELSTDAGLEVYRRAVQIATVLEHHLFDTMYHAVALERQTVLVTADNHYARKAEPMGRLTRLSEWRPDA